MWRDARIFLVVYYSSLFWAFCSNAKYNMHISRLLWEGVGIRQKWDVIGRSEGGGERLFWTSNLYIFLLKKIGYASWPDMLKPNNILSTRNLSLNETWLGFNFVRSHARCGCCSIVCLRLQVVQIKQVDCNMSAKNVNNFEWKTFGEIFGQLHTQKYDSTKNQIVRLQLNEKKSKES